jgi:hypothetical protein
MGIGQDLLNVPMGEMIYSMASSIAKSQIELDRASIEVAEMMGGLKTIYDEQGVMRFEDSRVFFGHEYMTVGEALVTQGDNPAVDGLIGGDKLTYKSYAAPDPTAMSDEASDMGFADVAGAELNRTNVDAYKASAQAIGERIKYYQDLLAADLAKAAGDQSSSKQTKYKGYITLLETNGAANRASVSSSLNRQIQVPTRLSLLELGFAPVFYAFIDTIIEVKISISITQESSSTITTTTDTKTNAVSMNFRFTPLGRGNAQYARSVSTSQVNATYSNRYSYTAEGSSLLRTKLTPLPPPGILEERIRAIMADDRAHKAAVLALMTDAAGS